MIDVDALSQPLSDEEPAGPNLEYDADFLALETASRGKPEQQFGDSVVPAEEPDWKEVGRMAVALLERTRDLRVACLLLRALCHTEGIEGVAQGLDLLSRLTTGLWPSVHPQLDPDDGNDPFMRLSALSLLADGEALQRGEGLVRDLRNCVVVSSRGMAVRMRDVELALELLEGVQDAPEFSPQQIEGMLGESVAAGQPDHAAAALAHLDQLLDFLRETVGSVETPTASLIRERLQALVNLRARATDGDDEPSAGEGGATNEGGPSGDDSSPADAGARRAGISGEIRNRADVERVLTKVCEYLERHEPTNPAPLLIRRAQRLMTMSFLDIMREMAPEGLDSVTKITGADGSGSSESSESY